MKAIILAAGMAKRLRPLTDTTPKCLLKVGDRSLLQRSMDALINNGVTDFVIVTGYLREQIKQFVATTYSNKIRVNFIYNDVYDSTNNIYSLWLAIQAIHGEEVLLLDSDLLYDQQIITRILSVNSGNTGHQSVLTLIRHELGEEEMKVVTDTNSSIIEISKTCDPKAAAGESLGIELMSPAYSEAIYHELDLMMNAERYITTPEGKQVDQRDIFYERAFERLIPQGQTFKVLDVTELFSCELDTVEDFNNAKKLIPPTLF